MARTRGAAKRQNKFKTSIANTKKKQHKCETLEMKQKTFPNMCNHSTMMHNTKKWIHVTGPKSEPEHIQIKTWPGILAGTTGVNWERSLKMLCQDMTTEAGNRKAKQDWNTKKSQMIGVFFCWLRLTFRAAEGEHGDPLKYIANQLLSMN